MKLVSLFGLSLCIATLADAQDPPHIDLGPDRIICGATTSSLDGRYAFFLLPAKTPDLPVTWEGSGPGDIAFYETTTGQTIVTLTARGTYKIKAEISIGALTAKDDVSVHFSPGKTVHWKFDASDFDPIEDNKVLDSSLIDDNGAPAGRFQAEITGHSRIDVGSRYGESVRLGGETGYISFNKSNRGIGRKAPFTACLWFKSEALQDATLFSGLPRNTEETGWSLGIRQSGEIVLALGNTNESQTLCAPNAYSPNEWTHVTFTVRNSKSHAGATIAKLFILAASDEPPLGENIFSTTPKTTAAACFEDLRLKDSKTNIKFNIPDVAPYVRPIAGLSFDDVRLFHHELSDVEIQDARLRRQPWRIRLLGVASPYKWILGRLQTTDPNLCDQFSYQVVDDPGSDAASFQILSGNLLSTADGFESVAGREYSVVIRSTDDSEMSVDTTFRIHLVEDTEPIDLPVMPPPVVIDRPVIPGFTPQYVIYPPGDPIDRGPQTAVENPPVKFKIPASTVTPPPPPVRAVSPQISIVRHYQGTDLTKPVAKLSIRDIPESPYKGAFTITFQAGSGNNNDLFLIDAEHSLFCLAPLDFSAGPLTVDLVVTDEEGTPFPRTFPIDKFAPVLNEFAAENTGEIADDISDNPDWIEIWNPGLNTLDMSSWKLSEDSLNTDVWDFPSGLQIKAQSYTIVFASDRNFKVVTDPFEFTHTNFKIARERCEYLALIAPDNTIFTEYRHTPVVPGYLSYGLLDGRQTMLAKTPLQANAALPPPPDPPAPAPFSPPALSHTSGYYWAPFSVSAPTNDVSHIVRYTIDGTAPNTGSPAITGSLNISGSMIFRASTFAPNGSSSAIVTVTYLFPDDILTQPEFNVPAASKSIVRQSMVALPVITILTDPAALSRDPKKATIIQFDPALPDNKFNVTAGVRLHGRRSLEESPKQSLRLQFQSEFGDGKLKAPLFGEDGLQTFDNLILRAGFNNSWVHPDADQRARAQGIRDTFARASHRAMGRNSARSHFVHLFLNATYWGVYELTELPDDSFAAANQCFDPDDFDIIDAGEEADGGRRATESWDAVGTALDSADFPALTGTIDLADLADFLVLHTFLGSLELDLFSQNMAEQNNWFAWSTSGFGEGFGFFPWDSERSLELTSDNYLSGANRSRLIELFNASEDAKLVLADSIHKHTKDGGALDGDMAVDRYNALANKYLTALHAELFRWGNKVSPASPATFVEWTAERARIVSDFLPARHTTTLTQFKEAGLYPTTAPAVIPLTPGFYPIGVPLTFGVIPPGRTIYFTIDGTDPRLPSGALSPSSILARSPFPLFGEHTITTRALQNGEWSALNQDTFIFGFSNIDPDALRITEIMNDPVGENDALSFIEFYNSSDSRIPLGGMILSGDIEYNFNKSALPFIEPHSFLLLVEDRDAFTNQYGVGLPVAGQYSKSLDKVLGKTIMLKGSDGGTLISLNPSRIAPWPFVGRAIGFSIVPKDTNPDYTNGNNWRLSSRAIGSPGYADLEIDARFTGLVFHEVKAIRGPDLNPSNAVELLNTNDVELDISGWFLSGTPNTPYLFQIPQNTTVGAGEIIVIAESGPLSLHDTNQIVLTPADENGNPLGAMVFTSALDSGSVYTRSRHFDSAGRLTMPLTPDTIGALNAPPRIEEIIINEVAYDGFIELLNPSDSYVEIRTVLSAVNLKPIDEIFEDAIIAPHGLAIIISKGDPSDFRAEHNVAEDIPIGLCLKSAKESLSLLDQHGLLTNESFLLSDELLPESYLDKKRSIIRINPNGYAPDPAVWRESCVMDGTPGQLPVQSLDEATAALPVLLRNPGDDPDGDGLSNLIEFAFASDPATPSPAPVAVSKSDDGRLLIKYRRPHDTFEGVVYILETSSDLQTWTSTSSFPLTWIPLADGTRLSTWEIPIIPDLNASFRIRVEMIAL